MVGKRFSIDKVRQESHENKEEQTEALSRLQGKMQGVTGVSKERAWVPGSGSTSTPFTLLLLLLMVFIARAGHKPHAPCSQTQIVNVPSMKKQTDST